MKLGPWLLLVATVCVASCKDSSLHEITYSAPSWHASKTHGQDGDGLSLKSAKYGIDINLTLSPQREQVKDGAAEILFQLANIQPGSIVSGGPDGDYYVLTCDANLRYDGSFKRHVGKQVIEGTVKSTRPLFTEGRKELRQVLDSIGAR